jgi:hypothetical protein
MAKRLKIRPQKILTILALALAVCGAFAISAQANYLDFFIGPMHPADAKIYFDGGETNPLVGFDINVMSVIGVDTASHHAVPLTISSGRLNFTTGNFTGSSSNTWNFGSGGTFTITGGIAALGIADGTTLVTGNFDFATVYHGTAAFKLGFGDISDTKNEDLLEYYGFAADQVFEGLMNLSFITLPVNPPDAFCSIVVGSGDLQNNPVPIPPAVLLLSSGLLGLSLLPWRKENEA